MSAFTYLTNEKHNSSAGLRERLKIDALRARTDSGRSSIDLGIPVLAPPAAAPSFTTPEFYDPVLRAHCRLDDGVKSKRKPQGTLA